MSDLPTPLMPWQICTGGSYWAARGDTQWSAVRVITVMRKKAQVERVIPRNGEVIHRKGKVRLDEMVKRDPKLKGKDKPKSPPAEVFEQVRELRAKEKQARTTPEEKPVVTPESSPKPVRQKKTRDPNFLRDTWVRSRLACGDSEEEALRQWDEECDDDW